MGRPRNFEPETVIEQAMEAFWTNGYAGTSPADLAAATGVAKGSLYHAFGSKRELFNKALDCYDRVGTEVSEEVLAQPGTAKECLRAYLVLLVDVDLAGPVRRGCLVANTALEMGGRDEAATREVRGIVERNVELFAERIRRGQRDGDVAPGVDAMAQAHLVMNTLGGLRMMAKAVDGSALYRIIDAALAGI